MSAVWFYPNDHWPTRTTESQLLLIIFLLTERKTKNDEISNEIGSLRIPSRQITPTTKLYYTTFRNILRHTNRMHI